MSTIEQRVYDTLSNDTSITALTALRIYPVVIPETTVYPCISYQVISGREISTLNHDLPTLRFKRIQINIWAEKYPEVKALEDLVTNALYTGEIKGHVENYRDAEDKELKIFGSSIDFVANNK